MTIYLDYMFFENLLIDYILLKETSYIARRKVTRKRVFISAFIASTYVVVMMYFKIQELNYLICKVLLVIIMIYISFEPKKMNEYVKLMALFFLISVINVGTLTVITNLLNIQSTKALIKIVIYVTSMLLSKFFMKYLWKVYKREIKNDDLIYEVSFCLGNKTYKYNAFLDTGNNVFSYTHNVAVIFAELLDEIMLESLKTKESFSIKTVTLSNQSNKQAYIFDKIEISKGNKKYFVKAAIVFEKTKLSKNDGYNMLLNYNIYTQDMGGIKIWI